jgi:hypothetical protein
MVAMPPLRVGEPIRSESLTVFPLFSETAPGVDYQLVDEAIAAGAVTIREVSGCGSVPDLLVDNGGEVRVLLIEGEELVGAKQNRILNTSVLLAAKSSTKAPVSCVEQGRWAYRCRQFGSGGRHSSSKLRFALKASVTGSVLGGAGHRSDQMRVWAEVGKQQAALGVESATGAMSGRLTNTRRLYYWGYHNDDPKQIFRSSLALSQVLDGPARRAAAVRRLPPEPSPGSCPSKPGGAGAVLVSVVCARLLPQRVPRRERAVVRTGRRRRRTRVDAGCDRRRGDGPRLRRHFRVARLASATAAIPVVGAACYTGALGRTAAACELFRRHGSPAPAGSA